MEAAWPLVRAGDGDIARALVFDLADGKQP